ncbi:MAG: hypothetical protein ACLFUR_05295 [Candidatus Hadarchaeia archaeon]
MVETVEPFKEILSNYFNQKFSRTEGEVSFWDREVGVYHASDFGKCLRKLYYEHKLGKRKREKSYPDLHLGNKVEYIIKDALANHYGYDFIKNSYRIELDLGDCKVVGQTDPVLVGVNGEVEKLFEIKSTKSLKYRKEEGPAENHLMQVHPYMKGLGLDFCTIVYVQKSDLEVLPYKVRFDKETFARGKTRILILHKALTGGSPPEAEPFCPDWECRFCNYSEECPKGGD